MLQRVTQFLTVVTIAFSLLSTPVAARPKQVRCGWIANPTPANWYLFDRQGRWTISTQGGPRATGFQLMPDFERSEWIATNVGSYGHGCGCVTVDSDIKTKRITRIYSVRQTKLSVCRADKSLDPM